MCEGHEEVLLLETEITIDLPEQIFGKAHFIDFLKKRKKLIDDQYHMNIKEVQGQMDSFLNTEHQSTAT